MATYRDAAIAEFQLQHTDYLKRGREQLRPVMTDKTGKLVLDPLTKTTVSAEEPDDGLVILTTSDGSNVSFAVYPDHADRGVWVVQLIDGEWSRLGQVADLDDVGELLAVAA